MKPPAIVEQLAVCSWSLQPTGLENLIESLCQTGVRRVQLALDPLRASPEIWGGTEAVFRAHGITVVSGMVGCIGEDYSTLETIRLTGGVAPDTTWEQNVTNFTICAEIAEKLGLKLVTFHAGFLPPDESDPAYVRMLERLKAVADIFAAHGISLGLETGQETALELAGVLRHLNHPNLGVNFDPANMILYGKGDPVEALRMLAPWIRQVHIKDARRTTVPGTWGTEVPAGTGDVEWRGFAAALKQVAPDVNLVIEREAGSSRIADICIAREMVERIFINS